MTFDPSLFINEKIKVMPPSGIRKFFDIVSTMEGAISLGVGEPDFVTPWSVRDAGIYSLEKGKTHYTSNSGMMELREEICNYLKRRFDLTYNYKETLVTVGGSEAIAVAMKTLLNPGDEVLVPEPSFVCYKPCAIIAGGTPIPVKTTADNSFKLTKEDVLKHLTPKTKLLVLSYPNNPTGAVMTKEDLEEIVEVVKENNLMVISDEIYAELTYGRKHTSIASFPDMKDRTILVNGFSKAYAMTGWRMGYVCGNEEIIKAMTKVHQYEIMCAPTVSQFAAVEALKNGDSAIEEMRDEYDRRRRLIVDGFNSLGLTCFEPQGAFYIFPSIQKTGMKSEEFCEKLLMEKKLALVPGTAFGESGEGFLRVSYAYSVKQITEALDRLTDFMNTL
ncbi:MAG: aminotransferase class I/II-fold pyridoxal phosphate-dependent enzyme [Ruminococcaceae bacterium]|nr:aminotransferase class I/II-fold pyridoxal phosphate-dependent enzyme [Oscillospiraceae bacterium]